MELQISYQSKLWHGHIASHFMATQTQCLPMRRILWLCLVIVFLAGCARQPDLGDGMTLTSKARSRLGWCPSPVIGFATFSNPDDIGSHRYGFSVREKNGIVYTARAGHVDIAHVRKAADWTAYLSELTLAQLQEGQTTFSFRQREPSRYFVTLQYPEYWGGLTDETRESMARDVAIELGQYLAFLGGTWHEIVTWFGHNNSGLISEFSSAFSWEDTFSNLLGTHVASVALHDDEHTPGASEPQKPVYFSLAFIKKQSGR
jgi:hypothetical protein